MVGWEGKYLPTSLDDGWMGGYWWVCVSIDFIGDGGERRKYNDELV